MKFKVSLKPTRICGRFAAALMLVALIACGGTGIAQAKTWETLTGPARVIDGDTLEVRGQRIRLHGIDAPEAAQHCEDADAMPYPCGAEATAALVAIINSRPVSCFLRGQDRYGRSIGICSVDDTVLNLWMVNEGWALAYRKYSADYVSVETGARHAQRGLWQGPFVAPGNGARELGDAHYPKLCPPAPHTPVTVPYSILNQGLRVQSDPDFTGTFNLRK